METIETKHFNFLSANGKTQIHAIKWIPNQKFTKILQISHGMNEYIERYIPFAEYLASKGFLVVGHDHLGHGKSIQTNDDLGYFGDNPSDLVVADMHKLRTLIQKEYPDLPYFMLGHSMGSYMLTKYLSLHSTGLTGAVIMGTGYVNYYVVMGAIGIIKGTALIYGYKTRSPFLVSLALGGSAYKKYDLTGKDTKNSWLTKDEKIVEKYYKDPLCNFTFTANGMLGLMEGVIWGSNISNLEKIDKNVPILFVSGSEDPVGNNGEGVKTSYDMMKKAGILDVEIKLYEGDRHEILNELDKEKVYGDLENWMNSKIKVKENKK